MQHDVAGVEARPARRGRHLAARGRGPSASTPLAWRTAVLPALAVVVAMRAWLGLVAWAGTSLVAYQVPEENWQELRAPGSAVAAATVAPWQGWDALWYQHLAQSGYAPGTHDAAFFPLLPLLIHVARPLVGGDGAVAGLAVSTLALVVALVLLVALATRWAAPAAARRVAVVAALVPTAFFLLGGFTESLSLALSLGALAAAHRRRWALAAPLALLAAITRPTGLVLVVPLAIEAVVSARDQRRAGRTPTWWSAAAVGAPVAGFAAVVTWTVTVLDASGGPLGAASAAWGQHLAPPWEVVAHAVAVVADGTHRATVVDLVMAVAVAATLPLMARRLPWSWVAYTAALLVVAVSREATVAPMTSAGRYLLAAFPSAVAVAIALEGRPRLGLALAAVAFVTSTALTFHWANGHYLG